MPSVQELLDTERQKRAVSQFVTKGKLPPRQGDPLAEAAQVALGGWLQEFRWDCFATFTFDDLALGRPELALDRAQSFLKSHYPQTFKGAFLASEKHYLKGVHAHGLIVWSGVGVLKGMDGRHHLAKESWWRNHGCGKFVVPANGGAAAEYVAKYVTKHDLAHRFVGTPVRG